MGFIVRNYVYIYIQYSVSDADSINWRLWWGAVLDLYSLINISQTDKWYEHLYWLILVR